MVRVLSRVAVVAALMIAGIGVATAPANAAVPGGTCRTLSALIPGSGLHTFRMCLSIDNNWRVSANGVTSHNAYTTIFINQCQAVNNQPVNCINRGAVAGNGRNGLTVPKRTAYWGHIYQTCGSSNDGGGGEWVYVCTNFVSAP